jgi:hypothetical protein
VQSSFCAIFFISLFFFHATLLLYESLPSCNALCTVLFSVQCYVLLCTYNAFSARCSSPCNLLLCDILSLVRYGTVFFFLATLLLYESLPSYNALCTMLFSVQCYVLLCTYNAFSARCSSPCNLLCDIHFLVRCSFSPHNSFSAQSSFFVQCLVHGSLFPCSAMLFSAQLFFCTTLFLRTMLVLCTMLFSVQCDAHGSFSVDALSPYNPFFCMVLLLVQHFFYVMLVLCNAFLHNPVLRFGLSKGLSMTQYAPSAFTSS